MESRSGLPDAGEKQEICPVFQKEISVGKQVQSASLSITALGVYEARMNGERVGKFIMAPGMDCVPEAPAVSDL